MAKKLKYLIIHCTDTPAGREVTFEDIKQWHLSPKSKGGRGWRQIGYSDMFHLDGSIENLIANNGDGVVDSWEITNGAKGYNAVSRHVVYVGGKGGDTRTGAQKKSMEFFINLMLENHPDVIIIGHNAVSGKACPNFNVQEWLKEIGVKK